MSEEPAPTFPCHCGLVCLTRDELGAHMQKAHGAPQSDPSAGFQYDTLAAVRSAARALKSAEDTYRAAQQAYAEAVKALSEEAVR